ncbi:MAG: TonB-dependent receptor, partial [Gemmatimonadota bacterium]
MTGKPSLRPANVTCGMPSACRAGLRGQRDPSALYLAFLLSAVLHLALAITVHAQTTGTIVGRVTDEATAAPLAGVDITIQQLGRSASSREDGRFVLAGVPTGTYTLRIELLSYRTLTLEGVEVRAGRRTSVPVTLAAAALELEPLVVEAQRIPLIEPEVSETHHVLLGRQLRELPTDATQQAIELTPGVTDGHFRGGRIGQETYVVDGLGVKNQLEASSQGFGLEYAPSALEEIDVTTGGFGVEYGSALSGVVGFVTRRGDPDRWGARASLASDHWAPDALSTGFSELSLSAGGPLRFLGGGSTLFADLLLQGMLDADARSNGLTCLRPDQAEPELAATIESLRSNPTTAHLYCPFTSDMIPYQQGDKLIGFTRLDVPIGARASLMGSLLHNRFQRQLYTQEFKYNPLYQLGQRQSGTLGTLSFDWAQEAAGKAYHVTARGAAMRLDRYLGVLDFGVLAERADVAGFGFGEFRFLGEEFVRLPIAEQNSADSAVPGYSAPGGATGSPFGPAAEGIFYTEGTPGIANWTRSGMLGGDLNGEILYAAGSSLRGGFSARFHAVENYERPFAYASDSVVNFAKYHPATMAGFAELQIATGAMFAATLGVRYEAFRSGLSVGADPS